MPRAYHPPFELSESIVGLCAELARMLGRLEGARANVPRPTLRKRNRVRTVRGSVAIEGNTLSEQQITALLDGKRVAGAAREIREVTNANAAYEKVASWKPGREGDLLAAHRVMMDGLIADAGRYRQSNVGVMRGRRVVHMAPPHARVPVLVRDLLAWVNRSKAPMIVRSCVVHYELLSVHPFSDGNGRMARLWQQVTLAAADPLWAVVPVESVIRERQAAYYAVLNQADHAGDATKVIEFLLTAMRDALAEMSAELSPQRATPTSRLERAREALGRRWFGRGEYMSLDRSIATATASRDLATGLKQRVLEARGARRLTTYRFRATG